MMRWILALAWTLLAGAHAAEHAGAAAAPGTAGEQIYRLGVLPGGQALRGQRDGGLDLQGAAAACLQCHRRSGFGAAEGTRVIPPITGKYLFRPHGPQTEDLDLRYMPGYQTGRKPYDESSLALAIREGIGRNGRTLSLLMPRYALDDAAMAALIDYLRALSSQTPGGVTEETLHFATIIAPDTEPARREAMLQVMRRFFADKDDYLRAGSRPMVSDRGVQYRVRRAWELHVWQLSGPPDTWEAQLDQYLAREPVFAVISGLGGANWAPVHHFCERAALPCILPNVDLPVDAADTDFYTIYFSRGVLLEAALLARRLAESGGAPAPQRIVQIARADDVGAAAAASLRPALGPAGAIEQTRLLDAHAPPAALRDALATLRAGDAAVLWLRADDLQTLADVAPPSGVRVYLSGIMAGLERAPLPAAWRGVTLMTYPFDLPAGRATRMNFPLGWFHLRGIPVTDERLQTDTYVACGIVSEMVAEMLDVFVRDFLIERVEVMVSRRLVNGYYPRLGLASGQRFASKGAYLVRFAAPEGTAIAPIGEWTVP